MSGYFCIGFIYYMFKGKSLTDYTNHFLPNNFKKNDDIILSYFLTNLFLTKMVECNSIEPIEHNSIDTSNLNNQHFRLNKSVKLKIILLQILKKEN